MSKSSTAGFGKFVPGFDFLQNLAQGATQGVPNMPGMGSWVAPTLNTEEIDKRITELKAVHFWLDQNTKALAATIQALEVQKLTLAALKGMNLSMGEIANAFKMPTPAAEAPAAPAPSAPTDRVKKPEPEAKPDAAEAEAPATKAGGGLIDTMQMWTALTQQFQHIAADAMKEASKAALVPGADAGKDAAADDKPVKRGAAKKPGAKKAAPKPVARKVPAKRSRST